MLLKRAKVVSVFSTTRNCVQFFLTENLSELRLLFKGLSRVGIVIFSGVASSSV